MDPPEINDTILRDVIVWKPDVDRRTLARVVERVARALVPWSSPPERAALAHAVGDAALRGAESDAALEIEELYAAVGREASLGTAAAVELTQSTLGVLARAMGTQARRRLAAALPPAWSLLLEDPHDTGSGRVVAAPNPAEGHTLASGRPGASTPLADAVPDAEADSIASCDDPHGDRKLSGAGTGPERRTLAGGRR